MSKLFSVIFFPSVIYTNGGKRLKLNNLWPEIGAVLVFTPFCLKMVSFSQPHVIQHILFAFLVSEIRAEHHLLNLGPPLKSTEETHPFSLKFLGDLPSPSLLPCLRFDALPTLTFALKTGKLWPQRSFFTVLYEEQGWSSSHGVLLWMLVAEQGAGIRRSGFKGDASTIRHPNSASPHAPEHGLHP